MRDEHFVSIAQECRILNYGIPITYTLSNVNIRQYLQWFNLNVLSIYSNYVENPKNYGITYGIVCKIDFNNKK